MKVMVVIEIELQESEIASSVSSYDSAIQPCGVIDHVRSKVFTYREDILTV